MASFGDGAILGAEVFAESGSLRRRRWLASLWAASAIFVAGPAVAQASGPNRVQPSARAQALADATRFEEAYALVDSERAACEARPATPDACLDLMLTATVMASMADQNVTAMNLAQRTLALSRQVAGDRDLATASAYANLGSVFSDRNDFDAAETNLEDALRIFVAAVGEIDFRTSLARSNLGTNLTRQGRFGEAEAMHRRALASLPQTDTYRVLAAETYRQLATAINAQGRASEAEPSYRKAFDLFQQSLGPYHPLSVTAAADLAYCLEDQGLAKEAEQGRRNILAYDIQYYGHHHKKVATAYNNLGENLVFQKRYRDAEPLLRKALALRIALFGERDGSTATSYANLADLLGKLGKIRDAVSTYQHAIRIRVEAQGDSHYLTIETRDNLGLLVLRSGPDAEIALSQYREIDSALRRRLGKFEGEDRKDAEEFRRRPIYESYVDSAWRVAHRRS